MKRRFPGGQLVVATHNAGKLAEIAALFDGRPVEVVSAGALGLPEPPETETSFVGNARIKAHAAARASGRPISFFASRISPTSLPGSSGL